jgi:ribosome maturation factor RimP
LEDSDTEPSPLHATLEGRITSEIERVVDHMGYEIVRVQVLGRDRPTVQIMADRKDGTLITIDDCERLNDVVSAALDVADLIKSAWTLEISSAGIDRPLTRPKDWNRFAGHLARAEVNMPINGRKRFSGTVLGADAEVARLRLDDGTDVALPLRDLRRAKLVLTDALIAATAQPAPDDGAPARQDLN